VAVAYGPGAAGVLTAAQLAKIIEPYTPYTQTLITRAVEAVGYKPPRVFTLFHDRETAHPED
jgi:hypothetical protein